MAGCETLGRDRCVWGACPVLQQRPDRELLLSYSMEVLEAVPAGEMSPTELSHPTPSLLICMTLLVSPLSLHEAPAFQF